MCRVARCRSGKRQGKLTLDESDRFIRIARLFELATMLFAGDADAARRWMLSPARALGRETPLSYARTEAGGREVENLIGRIQHGVIS